MSRPARVREPAPQARVERWLRHSGVPAFVPGYTRPAAVLRRWPWILAVAAAVAGGVLVAATVAGYGPVFGHPWPIVALVAGSMLIGVLAALLGLPEIAVFTVRWFLRTAWRSGTGMLRILPILLVALVFTFLSAETWQSIGTLTGTPLVLAAVLLLVLALVPILRSADDDHPDPAGALQVALPAELAGSLDPAAADAPPPLTLIERVNLRLIGALGRALVAVVVGLGVATFFCLFGVLTVSEAVTTSWAGAAADVWWQFTVGTHQYTLSAEHVRVALFLGVFSALYLVVSASTDRQLAGALSADAQFHVQQCLAVRAAHRASVTRAVTPAAPRGAARSGRRRGDRRRSREAG